MNDDLIKPDTNKPVVPEMDSDTPSITSEAEDIPAPKTPLAAPEASPIPPAPSVEPPKPIVPESPKPPVAPEPPQHSNPSVPSEPLMPLLASESHSDTSPKPPEPSTASGPHKSWLRAALIIVVAVLLVAGIVYAAYKVGNSRGYKNGQSAMSAEMSAGTLKVPGHATMVAQCTQGAGTQYTSPSDIPQGPIYNVWNNKVTGIEFMLAESKIAANKTLDLALKSQKYDHIDVMYEAAGHAGFTEPHYHLVLSMISYADEQKITCDSNSSNGSDTSHESHDMSSMDM